ncbi:MAG: DNA-binding protein [Limnohabitans sp.]|nr:DNA-binding protein [Limnohabitans sp.]
MKTPTLALPVPVITDINRPYWDGLQSGTLFFQHCKTCGHHWLPARSECPSCLHSDVEWKAAQGTARLISWVIFHVAYHPAVADQLPYCVATVELDEGPRLLSRLTGISDFSDLRMEQRLQLKIEEEAGFAVPRFVPV